MEQDRLAFLALHFVPGIGPLLLKQLISYCGSAESVFASKKTQLLKIPGIGPVAADLILAKETFALAEKELNKAEKEEVNLLLYTDKNFPSRLKVIEDAPSILYTKGNLNLNAPKTVAIVGTRQATAYGKACVEKIIEDLIIHQVPIVSGLAYGIDIHAHKNAVKAGLPTIAVLGSGIDVIYPDSHKDVAKKMLSNGGIITENVFGTKPDAHNFPARNRIIAGLCDAIIVIEAAEKGGALITAEIANSYNKDVFAVPGNLGNTYSAGCNFLIKTNKANLFTSVKDLEYIMNWNANSSNSKNISSSIAQSNLTDEEKLIVECLRKREVPIMIDQLSIESEIPLGKLSSLLLSLEFSGFVTSLPGKRYGLSHRNYR
jgi:DNA processing protein